MQLDPAGAGPVTRVVGRPGRPHAELVPGQPRAWITSSGAVNAAGQPVSTIPAACESAIPGVQGPAGSAAVNNCAAASPEKALVS